MNKPILCLDFDGVLHSYTSGWSGAAVIPDPPVPGAIDFLMRALNHFDVHVYSSRSHQTGGIEAMREWLRTQIRESVEAQDIPVSAGAVANVAVEEEIEFPTEKPAALVTIDDRAITFTGEWPSIDALLAFKPWNKR